MKDKVVWLTGSRGFIGRPLVSALKQNSCEIRCFTNRPLDESGKDQENDCQYMDYSNSARIKERVENSGVPDILIHMGWGGMTDPGSKVHLEENVEEGKALLNTAFECGVDKFVFIGSMNEYGGRTGALSEDMGPEGRLTNYAKGKIEVAKYGFQRAKELGKVFIHVRPFYVFGPGQRPGSLINDVYCSFKKGDVPELGPCEQFRDYIYVNDVADGILRATDINESVTLNLGSGRYVEVKEFVAKLWDCLGGDMSRLKFGARPMRAGEPDQPKSFADLTRLKEHTGWVPENSLEDGVRLTIKKLDEMPLPQ
ncbi:MAG: NAD(P)-dependent oxidoreductase [Nitrospina sp.]|jgi:nucleoside-diphosphate-sugar epimerase|nr:NAD(P)-dependent oxidoreductase [Nitrospina sp.]